MIRVQLFLSADHRAALSFFLQNTEGFYVVPPFEKHISVDRQIQMAQADVVLLDVANDVGQEVVGLIKKYSASCKVIVLTDNADLQQVMTALRNGANGYLLNKLTSFSTLAESIKVVNEGGLPISPFLLNDVLKSLMPPPTMSGNELKKKLTKRETEILQLLVNGFSYKGV